MQGSVLLQLRRRLDLAAIENLELQGLLRQREAAVSVQAQRNDVLRIMPESLHCGRGHLARVREVSALLASQGPRRLQVQRLARSEQIVAEPQVAVFVLTDAQLGAAI